MTEFLMPQSLSKLWVHIIFGTKGRYSFLSDSVCSNAHTHCRTSEKRWSACWGHRRHGRPRSHFVLSPANTFDFPNLFLQRPFRAEAWLHDFICLGLRPRLVLLSPFGANSGTQRPLPGRHSLPGDKEAVSKLTIERKSCLALRFCGSPEGTAQ